MKLNYKRVGLTIVIVYGVDFLEREQTPQNLELIIILNTGSPLTSVVACLLQFWQLGRGLVFSLLTSRVTTIGTCSKDAQVYTVVVTSVKIRLCTLS